jgi:predicted RNase H-related nuclease YkuK (DUF458 family)
MDFWIVFGSFLIGTVGALVIVWLRWIGTLPKFSSSVEIESCEEEYKKVSAAISKKLEEQKDITDAEVQHSNELRDDIWRQRLKSFSTSAILYATLGGATAVLFVGFDLQNITDSTNIIKLLAAGAMWTTFYSFLDVRKTAEVIDEKKEMLDEQMLAKMKEALAKSEEKVKDVIAQSKAITSNLKAQLFEEKNRAIEYAKKYNEVVDEYNKLVGNGDSV